MLLYNPRIYIQLACPHCGSLDLLEYQGQERIDPWITCNRCQQGFYSVQGAPDPRVAAKLQEFKDWIFKVTQPVR